MREIKYIYKTKLNAYKIQFRKVKNLINEDET